MHHHRKSIVYRAGRFVTHLLANQLPPDRVFHNVHHTFNVVQGIVDIGHAQQLDPERTEILLLAAWFHDTGHVETYAGHEAAGARIATEWLIGQQYPEAKLDEVVRCIMATTMPQRPRDEMEKIICDADLYHLSFSSYDHYQEVLREEWKKVLGIEMEDEQWEEKNDEFLRRHHYWTDYGQRVLEKKKWLAVKP